MFTDTEEFKLFHDALTAGRPHYHPWYFLLNGLEKDPLEGQGWKAAKHQLSFDAASRALTMGYNIGIAGTDEDGLVIIDVDDEQAFKDHAFPDTLTARSSSRKGVHYFFWTDDKNAKVNIALEHKGEIRSDWQYVVAPGSYAQLSDSKDEHGNVTKTAEQKHNDLPEEQKAHVGKYTLENIKPLATITYDEFPEIFKTEKTIRSERDKARENKPTGEYIKRGDSNRSALYELEIDDVVTAIPDQGRHPSLFHDSHTGKNTSLSKHLLHCWRHQVSHNAISALAVMAGIADCVDAGTGHKHSGSGSSSIDYNDGKTIYNIWQYAKNNGYIPQNDNVPTVAASWFAVTSGFCNEQDIKDGWMLPKSAFIKVLESHGLYAKPLEKIEQIEEEQTNNMDDKKLSLSDIKKLHQIAIDNHIEVELPEGHFLNVYSRWMDSRTDGYYEYKVCGGLWLLSAITNGCVELRLRQEVIKPNLFIILLGASTEARKSTVINKTRDTYEIAKEVKLYNDEYSIEGYLETLSSNPINHYVRDEVAGLLAKMQKKYNDGIFDIECLAYDGQSFQKTLAGGKNKEPRVFRVDNPYVTKFYGTTPDNFARYITIDDFLSGYGLRFLYAFPKYKKPRMAFELETDEDVSAWAEMTAWVKKFRNVFTTDTQIKFTVDKDAMDYFNHVIVYLEENIDKQNNNILVSAMGRLQVYILKIAMLIEIGKKEMSFNIDKASVAMASDLVISFFLPCFIEVIDRLQDDIKFNQIEKIRNVLRRLGGMAQHSKLLHDSKLKSKDFNECIDTMLESNAIQMAIEKGTDQKYYVLNGSTKIPKFDKIPSILSIPQIPLLSQSKANEENLENSNKLDKYVIKSNPSYSAQPDGFLRELENLENLENRENFSTLPKNAQIRIARYVMDFKRANYSMTCNVNPEQFTYEFCQVHEHLKTEASRIKEHVIHMNTIGWK